MNNHQTIIISSITSAYYAKPFIEKKIVNLLRQSIPIQSIFVCKEKSFEHEAIRYSLIKYDWKVKPIIITTKDIPPLYVAWNMAVKHIETDFITNANTDDTLATDGVETLVDTIAECDICYGSYYWKDTDGKRFLSKARRYTLSALKQNYFLSPFPIWRRSLHDKFGLFDEKYYSAGDYEFFLRCVSGGASIMLTTKVIGDFLWHGDNLEKRYKARARDEVFEIKGRYQ